MNKEAFFSSIRSSLFNGKLTQGVVDTAEAIISACDNNCITDYRQRAYIFATAYHEAYHRNLNPNWEPVREGFSKSNAGAIKAVTNLFNSGKISRNYASPEGNGRSYYGRGYVQITHAANYRTLGARLGIDLYNNPDLALDRPISADILVIGMKEGLFTGRKLSTYFTATLTDNVNARRVINGTDKASLIAGYADKFYLAMILK